MHLLVGTIMTGIPGGAAKNPDGAAMGSCVIPEVSGGGKGSMPWGGGRSDSTKVISGGEASPPDPTLPPDATWWLKYN